MKKLISAPSNLNNLKHKNDVVAKAYVTNPQTIDSYINTPIINKLSCYVSIDANIDDQDKDFELASCLSAPPDLKDYKIDIPKISTNNKILRIFRIMRKRWKYTIST
jgi:hypothetical protein